MEMEGCSSDGSWSVNKISSRDLDKIDNGMPTRDVEDPLNQFNKSESFKCTPEKTRQKINNDRLYRQRRKMAAAELKTQIEHLQDEIDRLNAENTCLKGLTNGDAAAAITDILMKLEADDESKVKFSDFTGLDGERKKVGKYSLPLSLHPIANNIIDIHGDVSATGKMNPCASEPIYIMFCASVKEMNDLRLEQVTEDRLLKWRDAIKDALRINFKVDFAMEHLKKIARAYIVRMESIKLENSALRMFNFMDVAQEFNDKPVSSGEQPIIDCESVTGGDGFDGGKKKQLTASQDEFLEMMRFEVENKLDAKRKLLLTMKESLRDAEVGLQEKVKELEMIKMKKRRLLSMEADKKKMIDAFMIFTEAFEDNDTKNTENSNDKAMMNTLLNVMKEAEGVLNN